MISNLIKICTEKMILSHLIGNNFPMVNFQQLLRKRLFGILFLESRFQNHPDTVLLEKYQSLSNHRFKYNSVHMLSLSLTPKFFLNLSFVCSALTVTPQIANICSLWTPCCIYLKSITLCNFLSLFPSASICISLKQIQSSREKPV